jgi:hypothetical protein
MSAWLWADTGHFFLLLIEKPNLLNMNVSQCTENHRFIIYNFTAIVKVLFHLFFVFTRNFTRMLHYCFRCQCFPVSNHIWCTCTNSAVSFIYRNICLQPFRFSGLCIYCWRHAEQNCDTPFACNVEEYIFLLTRFRTKSSFISNHRIISCPCNIRVLF